MKAFFSLCFIGLLCLPFVSCKKEQPRPEEPEMTLEVQAKSEERNGSLSSPLEYTSLFAAEDPQPWVPAGASETLLRVINVNLDLDRQEEQILVLREKNSVDSYLYVAILDYDMVLKDYRRVWEGWTGITNIRGFSIYLADLIGDHSMELVCSGIGPSGQQSMTVFRKTDQDGGLALSYYPIFNHHANGTIEILELPRTAAYESGFREGQSFPIITTIPDPDSTNMTDLLRNTYYWDFASRNYIKGREEKLLGRQMEQEQLLSIYRSGDNLFLDHINGPWMKNDGSGVIIDINRDTGRVSFFAQENNQKILDLYIWTSSYRLLSNVMLINGENELVNHYERVMNVRLVDANTLQITVQDIDTQTRAKIPNDLWTGQYFFLAREIRNNLDLPDTLPEKHNLIGKYTGALGEELTFTGNRFVFSSAEETFSGGFSMFFTGENIFTLNILNAYGISQGYRTFRYTFEERLLEKTIQRNLVLEEGQLMIHGFQSFERPLLRFQQIEITEE